MSEMTSKYEAAVTSNHSQVVVREGITSNHSQVSREGW